MLEKAGIDLNLGGRIRVAEEGLNSTVTGSHENITSFISILKEFDDSFLSTGFKIVNNMPTDRAFKDLKVLPVKELVF